jgi:large subunit ribosomal protein L28
MALRCINCGKGILYGHNVSHSKRRTRRIFKPNLHHAKITVDGTTKKVKLCTKCLRMIRAPKKVVEKTEEPQETPTN